MEPTIEELAAAAVQAGREAFATIKAGSKFNLLDEMDRIIYSSSIIKAMNDTLEYGSRFIAFNNLQEKNFSGIAATDTFTIGVMDVITRTIVADAELGFDEVDFVAKPPTQG